jgi:hypothetical protein
MTEIPVKIGHSLTKFRKQSFSLPKTLLFVITFVVSVIANSIEFVYYQKTYPKRLQNNFTKTLE